MADDPKHISTSSNPSASPLNAQIFTMPEAYRHGKEVKLVEPIKEQKPAPIPFAPTPSSKPKPLLTPPIPAATQNHKAFLIAGVIVLIAFGISGYILLRSIQKQQLPAPTEQSVPKIVSRPAVETPTPEIKPEPAEEATENPFAVEIIPGKDSDSDGLTDVEEASIYGTDPNLPDTDLDGFLDGNEVFHRYNPNVKAPGTLLDAGKVTQRTIGDAIQIAFPSIWQITETPLTFISTTSETVSIIFNTPISDWMNAQGGQEHIVKTISKSGYELYLTQDKRHALLKAGETTLEFRYELSSKTTIDYLQTFQMMLGSVQKL
jgi:hypothetical protein